MKKESKNRFCFKKARWILAATAALSLYPGSVFAEENIEVENTAAELSVEESATPVPEKTETTEISEPQLQEQPTKKEPAETTEVTEEKKVQETAETPVSTETVSSTEMITPTEAVTPGTESVKAFLAYTQADTSYSGSFRNGNGENISEIALSEGDNTSAYLVLTGTPSEEFSNSVLGTVTVTIGGYDHG